MLAPRRLFVVVFALLIACPLAASAQAAWVHDLDPFALQFTDSFGIRWYGLSYLAGFAVAWLLIRRVLRVGRSTLQPAQASDLVITLAIGIVVGGRLGYVLLYDPALLTTRVDGPPWWGVLAINRGGMASHGGMVGGIAAALWFAWRHKQRTLFLLDLFAFGAPLGLFFGRVANFINGELFGRACDPDFPLAVKFPQELYDNAELQQQAVAAVEARGVSPWAAGGDPIAWIIDAIQRGNEVVTSAVAPLLTPRHPSQLYAAVGEGLVVFAVLLWLYRKPVKAGAIGAAFCITYAVMRIVDELFRMPDAHLLDDEFATIGITRGQWLSALLLLVGVVALVIVQRSSKPRLGGWRAAPQREGQA